MSMHAPWSIVLVGAAWAPCLFLAWRVSREEARQGTAVPPSAEVVKYEQQVASRHH
jgi:hypothetical protein